MKRLCFACTLLVCGAFGQTKTQTFVFRHVNSAKAFTEYFNTIRGISESKNVTSNPADNSITVTGTEDQISVSAWLAKELDQPPAARQALVRHDYPGTVPQNHLVQIYYLAHMESPQDLQEVANMTRSLADIQRFFPVNTLTAIVARGEPIDLELGSWILGEVDQPPAAMKPGGLNHPIPIINPKRNDNMAQVYVL